MEWPIAEVARMSGVTARTLRHYDEIGLLQPARIGTSGRRYYGELQLLRLQQILVFGPSRKDGRPMTINRPENLFEGTTPAQYQQTLRDFPEHAQAVARRVAAMSAHDIEAGQRQRTAQMVKLAELMAAGYRADAGPVQAEIHAQYQTLTALRTVTADEYRAMGRSCVDNEACRRVRGDRPGPGRVPA